MQVENIAECWEDIRRDEKGERKEGGRETYNWGKNPSYSDKIIEEYTKLQEETFRKWCLVQSRRQPVLYVLGSSWKQENGQKGEEIEDSRSSQS